MAFFIKDSHTWYEGTNPCTVGDYALCWAWNELLRRWETADDPEVVLQFWKEEELGVVSPIPLQTDKNYIVLEKLWDMNIPYWAEAHPESEGLIYAPYPRDEEERDEWRSVLDDTNAIWHSMVITLAEQEQYWDNSRRRRRYF
jgi:hypothetical protein